MAYRNPVKKNTNATIAVTTPITHKKRFELTIEIADTAMAI
jgi:hypothetical protein